MTTPAPVVPSKAKSWVALVGSLLTIAIPVLVQVSGFLPPPWPAVIGGLVALLTWLGVYHAPYAPKDTMLVPTAGGGTYQNPWKTGEA